MNRSTLPQLARVIIIVVALASAAVSGAQTITQVHPSPPTSGNPPVVIAVLADHYAANEEQEFDRDVENFFKYGLLADGYYEKKKNDLRIVSIFNATPTGQESIYDFKIAPGVGNCAVVNAGDAVGKINTALALGNLHPVHTVVLGNHPYNFGCTDSSWTYVAVDAVGTDVLQHEFGHVLAGLFDEWSLPQNKTVNYPSVISMFDTRNCWSTRPPATKPPHWKNGTAFPKAKEYPECALFGKQVVHPFPYCRMGTKNEHPHHPAFCDVCAAEMETTFEFYRNWRRLVNSTRPVQTGVPSPQASHTPTTPPRFRIMNAAFVEREREREQDPTTDPIRILRFRVEINPATGAMTFKGRTAANGMYVPSYRRNGRFAFEYVVDGKPVEVGVIPDDVFEARGFRGGAPAHRASDDRPVEVVIAIPNEDTSSIQTGTRQLMLYRIPNDMPGRFITLGNFTAIRAREKPTATVPVK